MSVSSAPLLLKVMEYSIDTRGTPGGGEPSRLAITSVAGSWFEGNAIKFNINRYDEIFGACSCHWAAISTGGGGDNNGDDFPFLHKAAPPPGAWVSPSLTNGALTQVDMPTPAPNTDYNFAGVANRCYDGRDDAYTHNSNYDDAVNVNPSWPGGGAITGFRVTSNMPLTLRWKQIKGDNNKDVSGCRVVTNGTVIIEGVAVYGTNDGFRLTPMSGYSTAYYILRHCYGRRLRDEFVENDQYARADIEDCLADACYTFYSERNSGGAPGTAKVTNIRRCIAEILPMPYDSGVPNQNGDIFKCDPGQGDVNITDSVFLVWQPKVGAGENAADGKFDFPPGTHSGNIICWMGSGTYGTFASNCNGPVPAGFTVVNGDRTAYDTARLAWLAAHTGGGSDFAGATSGTINFADRQEAVLLEIPTAARAGTQGTRTATVALSVPVDCVIDPGYASAVTTIQDVVAGLDTIMATAGAATRVEGQDLIFTATREGALADACSIQWTATSDGGGADLRGTLTGTLNWTAGQAGKNVTVQTVNRTGEQGTRAVRFTLSTPGNCTIKAGFGSAATNLTDYTAPVGTPLVGVTAVATEVDESFPVSFRINRSRELRGAVTVHWAITSTGGADDWDGVHAGDATIANNSDGVTVTAQTAERPNNQGDRTLTCTLSAIVGGEIDGGHNPATCTLQDYTASTGKWWKRLAYRSGRPWAGGPCYWGGAWDQYERQVSYVDAFCGHHRGGKGDPMANTWEKVFGGPLTGDPAALTPGTQFGWFSANLHFSLCLRGVKPNKAWACFEFNLAPYDNYPNSVLPNSIINDYNDHLYDQQLKNIGKKIRAGFERAGWSLEWFLGRPWHEMNGAYWYSVTADNKVAWRNMLMRQIAMIREGADYHLRFMFAPMKKKNPDGRGLIGTMDSWIPWISGDSGNVDGISLSCHPGDNENWNADQLRAEWLRQLNGSDGQFGFYGLISDAARLAEAHDLCLGAFEWSPKWERCVDANTAYDWLYDEWFYPYRARMVGEAVHSAYTLVLGHNLKEPECKLDAEGEANWTLGVAKFKNRWGGIKPP